MKASEEDLDRIERRLERMPLEREALSLAMGQFGEDFDSAKWRAAYEAFSAQEHNRVVQVTGNLTTLVDNAVVGSSGVYEYTPSIKSVSRSGIGTPWRAA